MQPEEFTLKQTSPKIAGSGRIIKGDKVISAYDLVEQMEYFYVRVVKARDLPAKDVTGTSDPYAEVKLGNYIAKTKHFEKKLNPEWNVVFAFGHDQLQASHIEIAVKDKDFVKDDFIGKISFDIVDVPRRVPPDSPLAPQWYKLEDKKGEKLKKGEIMLAVWQGTQADEAFYESWHSDAASISSEGVSKIRGKVYLSPKLWYLRVNVIQCQDLIFSDKTQVPEVCVKIAIGGQVSKTRALRGENPTWNEDLLFVVAEPFEDPLMMTVENKDQTLGRCTLLLDMIPRRLDNKTIPAKWHNLEKHQIVEGEKKETKFASKIHLRITLDGGYHVLEESTYYSSDYRPTSKLLWKSSVGTLELGIISAFGLSSMKSKGGKGSTDAYCVAKCGPKWVRTRTIIDNLAPKWNEQYTWDVYDPCTVITIGVFDNCHFRGNGGKDSCIGKVRIRLSTLEMERVYTHSYPLIILMPSGVKKTGEIQLAIRFSSVSYINVLHKYNQPLFPKMHYIHPLSVSQVDVLRHHTIQIVCARLGRAEPPLKKETIEYMLDVGSHMWSLRKAKANFMRLTRVLTGLIGIVEWFDEVRQWKNPVTTVLIHVLLVILIVYPDLIFPTIFLYLFIIGIWRFRQKPRHPPHMNIRLSHADLVGPDELDEEFDTFPTSKGTNVVRMRYDRLRSIGGRVQTVIGDLAMQCERFESLLSWRDPRASALFILFCLFSAILLYVTPFQIVVLVYGFYVLRHPKLRSKVPGMSVNFFKRLPSKSDLML